MKDRSRKLAVINTGRKPQIETGGTTTTVVHAGIGGGGGGSMNLSDYLLKQIWDKAFEIRTTETGKEYLFGKLNFATQYVITMYANGGLLDLPSIFEGIPFDNKTIWMNPETKVVEVIGSTEEDEGSADFSNVKTSGEGNAFTSFVLSDDGKELTFVKGETFAKQSDYEALNTKVADFLEGSDTDNIINKWKELEAFLSGMKESDDLATILATKWTKDDAKIANWDTAFGWGDHSKAGYLKKEVIYDESIGCWKLEGDLLVTGGITMYANEGQYTPSTITDAVNIDNDTLIRVNGAIMLNPDIEIGGGSDIDLSEYAKKATTLSGYGITDAYTKTDVDELLEDKADSATTLAGYGITNAYTKTQVDNLLGDFVTSDDVETLLEDYLPLTGGTITGDLRLRKGSEYTSPYLYFGDGDEVWLKEETDTRLTIHADGYVLIDADLVVRGGITMYGNEGEYTPSTIMDAVSVDGQTIIKRNGMLMLNPDIEIGGGGGIDSITKQMVIDALGYTPYDEDNPDGYITGITKAMVTSALGFTPYNSTNPNGYVTSSGSVAYATSAGSAEDADYATTSGTCSGNAATATKATQDGNGDTISSTYLKLSGGKMTGQLNAQAILPGANLSYNLGSATAKWYNICGAYVYGYNALYVGSSDYFLSTFTNGLQIGTYSLFRINQDGTTRLYMNASGNFGIGTTSPQSKLHVVGTIQADTKFNLTDEDTGNATLGYAQGGTMILRHNSSGQTILSGSGGTLYFRPNGTSSDSGQCTISTGGNLLVAGGITMYSDLRKKTILNHVELSLKEVANAPLIEHYYNSDEKKTTHVGSVAQYWARLNDWLCKEDEEGFLTMEIQNDALASVISVARELTRYESKTDKQIKKLKKRIGELEEEIENLKKGVI